MCQELGACLVSASLIALGLLSGLSLPRQRRRLPFGYSCREDATRELAGVVGVMALFSLPSPVPHRKLKHDIEIVDHGVNNGLSSALNVLFHVYQTSRSCRRDSRVQEISKYPDHHLRSDRHPTVLLQRVETGQ